MKPYYNNARDQCPPEGDPEISSINVNGTWKLFGKANSWTLLHTCWTTNPRSCQLCCVSPPGESDACYHALDIFEAFKIYKLLRHRAVSLLSQLLRQISRADISFFNSLKKKLYFRKRICSRASCCSMLEQDRISGFLAQRSSPCFRLPE